MIHPNKLVQELAQNVVDQLTNENDMKALIAHDLAEKGASKPIMDEEFDMSDESASDNEDGEQREDGNDISPYTPGVGDQQATHFYAFH